MINRSESAKDETKYSWLRILLDAYDISDQLMATHLASLSNQGVCVACQKGCHACCLNPTVPITKLELMGISWYAGEKLEGSLRQEIKQQLYTHDKRKSCPFLANGCCSIYPVRPLSCRQFHVKSKPCDVGEDVLHTRPTDIVPTTRQIAKEVSMRVLDFYGIEGNKRKERVFEQGFMVQNSKPMHSCDWTEIGRTMDLFDNAT